MLYCIPVLPSRELLLRPPYGRTEEKRRPFTPLWLSVQNFSSPILYSSLSSLVIRGPWQWKAPFVYADPPDSGVVPVHREKISSRVVSTFSNLAFCLYYGKKWWKNWVTLILVCYNWLLLYLAAQLFPVQLSSWQ